MARRSDHSREELKELILKSATRLVAEQGESALNARALAADIGYSPGTIYNIFENMEQVSLYLSTQTMRALMEMGQAEMTATDPREALHQLARVYFRFTRENANLWHLVRARRWPDRSKIPSDYRKLMAEVLGVVESAFASLFEPHEQEARRSTALTLWASMDGISALSGGGMLIAMPERKSMQLAHRLIEHFVSGLEREHYARKVA
jgi:AcrR family transcriptional regulator